MSLTPASGSLPDGLTFSPWRNAKIKNTINIGPPTHSTTKSRTERFAISQSLEQGGRKIAFGKRRQHHDDGFVGHVGPCADFERGGDGGTRRNAAGNTLVA